jgi:hypothetical protein
MYPQSGEAHFFFVKKEPAPHRSADDFVEWLCICEAVATGPIHPSIRPSVHPRSGEAVKWRSGKVEKRSSGLDVRFSAPPGQSPGEAEDTATRTSFLSKKGG